ncbi:hypothetical protein DID77_03495 [Candidatus Marinamargulisbacteria bacterium SCGC AG-439-L15]|nr:hypothetical protein DID77_03495 [Candidatus Marinamargulisbacteria bacterium SCGC AG-439-L15]
MFKNVSFVPECAVFSDFTGDEFSIQVTPEGPFPQRVSGQAISDDVTQKGVDQTIVIWGSSPDNDYTGQGMTKSDFERSVFESCLKGQAIQNPYNRKELPNDVLKLMAFESLGGLVTSQLSGCQSSDDVYAYCQDKVAIMLNCFDEYGDIEEPYKKYNIRGLFQILIDLATVRLCELGVVNPKALGELEVSHSSKELFLGPLLHFAAFLNFDDSEASRLMFNKLGAEHRVQTRLCELSQIIYVVPLPEGCSTHEPVRIQAQVFKSIEKDQSVEVVLFDEALYSYACLKDYYHNEIKEASSLKWPKSINEEDDWSDTSSNASQNLEEEYSENEGLSGLRLEPRYVEQLENDEEDGLSLDDDSGYSGSSDSNEEPDAFDEQVFTQAHAAALGFSSLETIFDEFLPVHEQDAQLAVNGKRVSQSTAELLIENQYCGLIPVLVERGYDFKGELSYHENGAVEKQRSLAILAVDECQHITLEVILKVIGGFENDKGDQNFYENGQIQRCSSLAAAIIQSNDEDCIDVLKEALRQYPGTFQGDRGEVEYDENGNVISEYSLLSMATDIEDEALISLLSKIDDEPTKRPSGSDSNQDGSAPKKRARID